MKEALLYKSNADRTVSCNLCKHFCNIDVDSVGICKVRKNISGKLYSLNYAQAVAAAIDPVEKKPLYHFLPSTDTYSIAARGCNFSCSFCQNWHISQAHKEALVQPTKLLPVDVVKNAAAQNCRSISYTYSEPTVFFEYMLETAILSSENNLKNIMVTNGYMSAEALNMLSPYTNAANIDLKFFSETKYLKYCGAKLGPVLETIKNMYEKGIWIELTTLIIDGINDSKEELQNIVSFIASIDKNIPWHVSRAFPTYRLNNIDITPETTLDMAFEIAKAEGLKYIYKGNSQSGNDTVCPECSEKLIARSGYNTELNIEEGKCPSCEHSIPGEW